MLLLFSLGSYQALVRPPWSAVDEWGHTGYLMSLTNGGLPNLDTPSEMPSGASPTMIGYQAYRAEQWAAQGQDQRNTVWVANHPPGPYLLIVPGALLAEPAECRATW